MAIAILTMTAGAALVVYAIWRRISWGRMAGWSPVEGKLVASGIREGTLAMWSAPLTTYAPWVRYEYTSAEMPFVGSRITVCDRFLAQVDRSKAEKLIARLGETPTVYCNPQAPSRSCLDRKLSARHYNHIFTYAVIGILLLGIGSGIGYLLLQSS